MNIMEIKKYKLLQDFGVLKKGDIISRRWKMYSGNCIDSDYYCRVISGSYDYGFELHKKLVQNSPDWFAPFVFTTEDEVDIYEGESYFYVHNYSGGGVDIGTASLKYPMDFKTFSTRKAAEDYLKQSKKQDLLEDAKRKYPIGTKAKCLFLNIAIEVKSYNHVNYHTFSENELWFKGEDRAVKVYENGKWAVIIENFEIGDYFVYDNDVHKIDNIKISSLISNEKSYDKALCRKAENSEIISYYEKLGWIKGAKFKTKYGKTFEVDSIRFGVSKDDILVYFWQDCENCSHRDVSECTLIKELTYPKSWKDLKQIDGFYIANDVNDVPCIKKINYSKPAKDEFLDVYRTKKQAESAISYAQLSQLLSIESHLEPKYCIKSINKKIVIEEIKTDELLYFNSLEYANFSLKHHLDLWKKFYLC